MCPVDSSVGSLSTYLCLRWDNSAYETQCTGGGAIRTGAFAVAAWRVARLCPPPTMATGFLRPLVSKRSGRLRLPRLDSGLRGHCRPWVTQAH